MRHAPVPQASFDLLHLAARGLAAATLRTGPDPATVGERYAEAHLAALRAASAVLAARARPARVRRGPSSVWTLLPEVAPELVEWSAFFAAGAGQTGRRRGRAPGGEQPRGRRPAPRRHALPGPGRDDARSRPPGHPAAHRLSPLTG